jgi:hypothetical protein
VLRDKDYEYLIIRGCGGDLQDFKNGFEEMFVENNIVSKDFKFDECYSFEVDGIINIAFGLKDKNINMGKLAIVRLSWINSFGAIWLSDYIDNLKEEKMEQKLNISEDDFRSYLEVQKSGFYNMFDPNAKELTRLDKDTYLAIMKNYSKLKEKYPETYEKIFNKNIDI